MWTIFAAATAVALMWAAALHTVASLEATPQLIPVAVSAV